MDALSLTELHIIRSMLAEQYGPDAPFLAQLAVAKVENRRSTKVGIFVDLRIAGSAERVDQIDTEISAGYRTRLDPPRDLVGFTLFIRQGYLSFLEGYTFGNARWPREPMENWMVLERVT